MRINCSVKNWNSGTVYMLKNVREKTVFFMRTISPHNILLRLYADAWAFFILHWVSKWYKHLVIFLYHGKNSWIIIRKRCSRNYNYRLTRYLMLKRISIFKFIKNINYIKNIYVWCFKMIWTLRNFLISWQIFVNYYPKTVF